MGSYYTLCHSTYAYSLLFYKVYMKRENAGSWNSGLEKEQILETYSAQLQKSWNSTKVIFGNNKKYWAEEIPEGAHTLATRVGARPTPLGTPPVSLGPWQASGAHLLLYEVFYPGKNHKQAFRTKHRRHEAEPCRNQSRAPAELFCRGTSLREGEIITIDPLVGRGSISINIFTRTISSQTLVHLLYPIFVPKPQIGTCELLVVLITPCSWC